MHKAPTTIAIIPARGGSKGIPGKNLRLVSGKPLLAWSIEQARQTPQISRVLVSTDCAEIAEVARRFGAEVIERPADISGDTASSESCLIHALDWLESAAGLQASGFSPQPFTPDLIVFLQATSPMRESDDIQKAIETMEREQADSLFSACRVEGFVWRVEGDARVRSFSYDHQNRPRRQDAPEDLIENGSIYIFKPWVLRQFNNRLGGKIAVYRMPALNSFQIDEPADLELIELLMAFRRAEGGNLKPEEKSHCDKPGPLSSTALVSGYRSEVATLPAPISALSFQVSDFEKVRLLALDFDGVLTDNRVLVSEDGTESVLCDRGDGFGIGLLNASVVAVVVISKEKNPVVAARCHKLGIECLQSCDDKLPSLQALCSSRNLSAAEVAYVGNDLNDLECLRWVGLPIAVSDAVPEVLSVAKWVTTKPGGHGAVREICDMLLTKGPIT